MASKFSSSRIDRLSDGTYHADLFSHPAEGGKIREFKVINQDPKIVEDVARAWGNGEATFIRKIVYSVRSDYAAIEEAK